MEIIKKYIEVRSQKIISRLNDAKLLITMKTVANERDGSDRYPVYLFRQCPEVQNIIDRIAADHNGKTDRSIDDPIMWETFSGGMFEDYDRYERVNTRNMFVVDQVVKANMFNHLMAVFEDAEPGSKKMWRFCADPLIRQIRDNNIAWAKANEEKYGKFKNGK